MMYDIATTIIVRSHLGFINRNRLVNRNLIEIGKPKHKSVIVRIVIVGMVLFVVRSKTGIIGKIKVIHVIRGQRYIWHKIRR